MISLIKTEEETILINNDVVRILEETLAMAKSGDISELAVCYIKNSGIAGNNFSYNRNRAVALLGGLQVTQRDILDRLTSIR